MKSSSPGHGQQRQEGVWDRRERSHNDDPVGVLRDSGMVLPNLPG